MLKIQIPTTYKCQLNCITCIKSQTLDYIKQECNLEQFKKIIDKLPETENVDLTPIIGEIFEDKNIFEKFEYLENARHIKGFDFVTNLTAKIDYKKICKYKKLKQIFISVYGLNNKDYIKYTQVDIFETFIKNLYYLLYNKKQLKTTLYFRYDTVENITGPIKEKLKHFEMCGLISIDDTTAKANFDWAGRHMNIENLAEIPEQNGICLHAIEQNCIWPNGDVSICGMVDYNKDMIKGNIFDNVSILNKNIMHSMCEGCREYELK